jgi:hypothetical protein
MRDEIVDSLMEQKFFLYIKYDLFHDIIAIVKFTIFKFKTININIYIFLNYFITSISKAFLTKHIKLLFFQP